MSLWKEYLLEREGKLVIEDDDSLVSYCIEGDVCLIGEVYIKKEKRHGPKARQMLEQIKTIAKDAGCTRLLGTVNPGDRNAQRNLAIQIALGFNKIGETNQLIVLAMQLE